MFFKKLELVTKHILSFVCLLTENFEMSESDTLDIDPNIELEMDEYYRQTMRDFDETWEDIAAETHEELLQNLQPERSRLRSVVFVPTPPVPKAVVLPSIRSVVTFPAVPGKTSMQVIEDSMKKFTKCRTKAARKSYDLPKPLEQVTCSKQASTNRQKIRNSALTTASCCSTSNLYKLQRYRRL